MSLLVKVALRNSSLSRAQLLEVEGEWHNHHPQVTLEPQFVLTMGDRDQNRSLRALDKSDFFTREIDDLLLAGDCRLAIHSAKDLPDPLPEGLVRVALTRGVDPRDALVLRCRPLPAQPIVATSSVRRDEAVRALLPHARVVDIRGNVDQRLSRLASGEIDALVVAEAALIRLGLTHLERIYLEGPSAVHQGRLALVARADDFEMAALAACLDTP